jgi:hypothetical protein
MGVEDGSRLGLGFTIPLGLVDGGRDDEPLREIDIRWRGRRLAVMSPEDMSRRDSLKLLATGAAAGLVGPLSQGAETAPTMDRWSDSHDRVWLSGDVWANPMEDWCLRDGGAECLNGGGGRSVHSLTHQIARHAPFRMGVDVLRVEDGQNDGGAGFRIGLRSEIDDYRSNCFVTRGLRAGWLGERLVLGKKSAPLKGGVPAGQVGLLLEGKPAAGLCRLTLTARSIGSGRVLGTVTAEVPPEQILGNVSLAHNLAAKVARRGRGAAAGARYRFHHWTLEGEAFQVRPEQRFGPILWAMYSLSDSRSDEGWVLKLSALTGPMGDRDAKVCELFVERADGWISLGEAGLDPDAWVATFRIPGWDAATAARYKVVYRERHRDGSVTPHEWIGTIRANPAGRPLRMAALTCQNDYAFPYAPVAENLARLDPDLLFFSGDQIYESHGGFGIIRNPAEPAILNYLRKFYQFGWAFGDVMRDRPTLCLPDDHDVFQGNLWGEGGAEMKGSNPSALGGYIEPVRMVNAVHRTTVAHHPDPYDPTPAKRGMNVYYGEMVYGGVGFAILADRQWKSGPERVDTGGGRRDHVEDADFDTTTLDPPGLVLLGERQEKFLKAWAGDWRGHSLKAVLSQTVFAGMATHHGGYGGYLKADLDCGGWPQTARDRAIRLMRPAMALHINGDQHLASLVQYGVETQRDACWSFCTPAIAVGYPRWWRPDEVGMRHANRPQHGLPHTGEYLDGLGNKVFAYAVGNPEVGRARNRYEKAHEKGSGFGFITFDTDRKTYHLQAFRFRIDVTEPHPENQFPGWPVTLHQSENRGENRLK